MKRTARLIETCGTFSLFGKGGTSWKTPTSPSAPSSGALLDAAERQYAKRSAWQSASAIANRAGAGVGAVINEATPHLLELASMGRVGEFAYACEIGEKERKHHGQGAVEVFTSGAADMHTRSSYSACGAPQCVPLDGLNSCR